MYVINWNGEIFDHYLLGLIQQYGLDKVIPSKDDAWRDGQTYQVLLLSDVQSMFLRFVSKNFRVHSANTVVLKLYERPPFDIEDRRKGLYSLRVGAYRFN